MGFERFSFQRLFIRGHKVNNNNTVLINLSDFIAPWVRTGYSYDRLLTYTRNNIYNRPTGHGTFVKTQRFFFFLHYYP